jgi:hypothetical protein
VRKRSAPDFELAKARLEDWLRDPAIGVKGGAFAHLSEHGSERDAPPYAVPEQPCGHIGAQGRCGYSSECRACGVSAVLIDLDFALADRRARAYTVELLREIAKLVAAYERAENDFQRNTVVRRAQRSLPSALDAFIVGRDGHRQETLARVRAQVAMMQRWGYSTVPDLESRLVPDTSPQEVVNRLLEQRESILGLLNPRDSLPEPHVDPDRSLLGSLQEHLSAHGFLHAEIAALMPDGEGGTKSQQRRRVEDRLRKRGARRAAARRGAKAS